MDIGASRLANVELGQIRAVAEKARNLEKQGKSVIHLEMGEPDFSTPKHIVQATQQALERGEVHYAPTRGLLQLREDISRKLKDDNNINSDPETDIIVTAGASQALLLAFLGHCNPGDEVLIIEPAYIFYRQLARMTGAVPITIPTSQENNWVVDPNEIEKALTPHTKMILINSPNNPTGAVYPKEVQERIAEIAIQHDLLVVSDEIYEKIIYQEKGHFSIASIPGMEKRTITINGYSKAYAMTGWRLGYIVSSNDLMIPMLKVQQYSVTCIPTFTQFGASEAINGDQQCINDMVDAYRRRRDIVHKGLLSIDEITCALPEGAFYAFPNITKFGLTSKEFAEKVLNEAGVALVPGSVFSDVGEGFVRLSFAASEKALMEAIERMKICLENLVRK
ncbi:hypothetical protein CWR48_05305 [Oceanobacillus arenosus]|uniref:Aminotransferase n=1 Tax=Oceanobacillus arenosus TaxID=1229153 RepID=A0A3D8PXZ0_9BACI|nr:pyridoxal phosphate-dependent aminotransferase [Oceanobacillus arenosus]RDW20128.1 hypothetical protein CWR48_05305 [Oceanobacillus arenosus]